MKRILALAAAITMMVSLSAAGVYGEQARAGAGAGSVLRLIETYNAPPFPRDPTPAKQEPAEFFLPPFEVTKETYDYRKEYGKTVPPTLTDAFIVDLWQRITKDLAIPEITVSGISEDQVTWAMNIYLQRDWRKIAGYRPWTHWNFIRSLDRQQRDRLAKDVAAYLHEQGIKEGN